MVKSILKIFIFLSLILLVPGCGLTYQSRQNFNSEKNMAKKVLMVVAPKDFRDDEYLEPRQVLERGGVEIKVASIVSGQAKGAAGTIAPIDLTVGEASANDFDAVLFVGGPGMVNLVSDQRLTKLAKAFYQAGKLTTAICVAPAILAKAGILKGKKATSWSGAKNDLIGGGAIYTDESVTVDGQIITASGPAAAKEFGEKVIKALK